MSTRPQTKGKGKTKRSSGLNPAGNSMESQIGIAEEQPRPASEIEWQLHAELLASSRHRDVTSNDQGGPTTSTGMSMQLHPHGFDPHYDYLCDSQGGLTLSASASILSLHHPHIPQSQYDYLYCPAMPTRTDFGSAVHTTPPQILDAASSFLSGMQGGHPTIQTSPPPNIDYTLQTLTSRSVRSAHATVRAAPYNADLRHVGLIERPLRPGELVPNEAFAIPGRSAVIRQVGETTRSVGRNLSAIRLPPAHAGASNTIDKRMASEIKVEARSIFKRLLFSRNLLPDSEDLVTMIREALHSAASSRSQAGVNEWVKKNVSSETKRLRDIAINVRNDFKDVARILAPSLYNLTLPIHLRGQEVPLRQQEIPALLENFSWIDETHYLDDGSVSRVPFGHPAVIQVVVILLWGEKNYWRFVDVDHKNISPTIIFTGIVLQQALQEYSTGTFSPHELNARALRSSYDSLHSRLSSLQGGELEQYNLLVDDLFARGDEMLGRL